MVFLLSLVLAVSASALPCSPSQVSVGLTQCDLAHTRSAVFVVNGTCDNPPARIAGLSCELECPPGQFLGFDREKKASKCEECPANTFSNGGGVRFSGIEDSWSSLSSHFIAYCYVSELYSWIFKKDCDSWAPSSDGQTLISGNTTRRAWAQSELVYYADIVKPGLLTIEYRKKTRMYNGGLNGIFDVFVDEEPVLEDTDLGNESWKSVSFPLKVGMAEIVVIYEKYNAAGFEDLHAQIRMIEVRGTEMNALTCLPCTNGFSLPGSEECSACRANDYFEAGSCRSCPVGTYSLVGSKSLDSCKPKPPCTESDYHENFTGCINGSSSKHYEWNQPHICNENTGVSLPLVELGHFCEQCAPGNYHQAVREGDLETRCSACPPGAASNGTSAECVACAAGFFAPRVLNYSSWSPLPNEVSNDCRPFTGQSCSDSSGWIASSAGLTSGSRLASNCYLTLAINADIVEANSYFQFSWSMTKNHSSMSQLSIEVDGNLVMMQNAQDYHSTSRKLLLSPGSRVLRFVYHHAGTADDTCTLHWVAIRGADAGGAAECEECAAGYVSTPKSASCTMCPAGSTSNAEKSECVQCPSSAYSAVPGSAQGCTPCPQFTVSNPNRTMCVGVQNITLKHAVFPLENLTGLRTGTEGYVDGLCSKEKFALFCKKPFYGPIRTVKNDYYVSVLNPGRLSLDAFGNLDELSAGYAYGVINRSELNTEHLRVPDATCATDLSRMVVNLGSKVENVTVSELGFNISYTDGAPCGDGHFSSELAMICEKRDGDGFPDVLETNQCSVKFVWKSRLACRLCEQSEMSIVRGSCIGGVRYVYFVEGHNCTLRTQDRETLYMLESCTVMGEVLGTTIALIIIGIVALLLMATVVVFVCFCKVNQQYQSLLRNQAKS